MWNKLTLVMALFLVLRVDALSERIERLNASGAAEAEANTRVASQLAAIQRTVGTTFSSRTPNSSGRRRIRYRSSRPRSRAPARS
jgi:hypothetical protein